MGDVALYFQENMKDFSFRGYTHVDHGKKG